MSAFTEGEVEYLKTQRIGRLATVGAGWTAARRSGWIQIQPQKDLIEIGGHSGFAKRKKYRDVVQNPRVAFVIDDVASMNPWSVRGVEIRGRAEILKTGGAALGPGFDPEMMRIVPERIVSWGINRKISRM